MTKMEIVKYSMHMLYVLAENGIMCSDWQYVRAYEQFVNMRHNRVKYTAAIMDISQELGVSPRTLERAFKRLGAECKL